MISSIVCGSGPEYIQQALSRYKQVFTFFLIALFLIMTLQATTQKRDPAIESGLVALVDSFRQAHQVPGVAVCIVFPDTSLFALSGTKKKDHGHPLTLNDKFQLSSNTKAITATIAATMVASGILEWEDKFVDLFPELESSARAEYHDVTLVSLLSNRSLLPPFEDKSSREWKNIAASITREADQKLSFAHYVLSLKPVRLKKSNHAYSNAGFILAALMMERSGGRPWETLVAGFCAGIGCKAYCGFPRQENESGSHGHTKKGRNYFPVDPEREEHLEPFFSPAGNLSLSIKDFSFFLGLHLKGLLGEANLLEPEEYRHLHYGYPDYSLGWYNGFIGDGPERFSYHGGSLGTFSSAAMLSADREVAIGILINADSDEVSEMKNELRKALWSEYGRGQ